MTRRVTSILIVLALAMSGLAECAGWQMTPAARQACCSQEQHCPMHDQHGSSFERAVSQADADRCCASSERGDSTPRTSSVAAGITLAVLASPIPVRVPQLIVGRAHGPALLAPASLVPKHLLLSVFLV